MRVEFDIFGERQVARQLLRVGEHARNAAPAFRDIADRLRQWEREQFDSRGVTGSGGWPPLQPETIEKKRSSRNPKVRANAEKILQATGALMASLTQAHDEDHIERVQRDGLDFGSRVDYGIYHQQGRGVPKRKPVDIRESQRREMVRIIQRWTFEGYGDDPPF